VTEVPRLYHNLLSLDFVHRLNFVMKHDVSVSAVLPSSEKKAPDVVDYVHRAILNHWGPISQ
jgi:hypothetical protein